MTALRLFSGLVQMRQDVAGETRLSNQHWAGWYRSKAEAIGDWISQTTAQLPNYTMSYHAAYDITDVALRNLERPQ